MPVSITNFKLIYDALRDAHFEGMPATISSSPQASIAITPTEKSNV